MRSVSIIIVTYNAGQDLQACFDSIRKQASSAIEVIVVDGGSKDNTVDIIRSNNDIIATWISEKDDGIYDAMNKAIKLTKQDWIYFMGADDTLLPEFSTMLEALRDPYTIYYGSVLAKGGKYLGYMNPYRQAKIGICHQAMIYPKYVFNTYQFDPIYRISADHHLNMKCWADKTIQFQFVDLIIANFNHTGISSVQKDQLFEKRKASLILKHFGAATWARFIFRKLKSKFNKKHDADKLS